MEYKKIMYILTNILNFNLATSQLKPLTLVD